MQEWANSDISPRPLIVEVTFAPDARYFNGFSLSRLNLPAGLSFTGEAGCWEHGWRAGVDTRCRDCDVSTPGGLCMGGGRAWWCCTSPDHLHQLAWCWASFLRLCTGQISSTLRVEHGLGVELFHTQSPQVGVAEDRGTLLWWAMTKAILIWPCKLVSALMIHLFFPFLYPKLL